MSFYLILSLLLSSHPFPVISPADKALPAKLNLDIIKELQNSITDVFNPKAVYDGRKNMFSIRPLPLGKRDNKGQATESVCLLPVLVSYLNVILIV